MKTDEDEMLYEYDFTSGVHGKYVDRVVNRKNVIVLWSPTSRKCLPIPNR